MKKNQVIYNIMWLVYEKLLVLVLQFFVGVKVANYYGENIYGKYSYAIAIVAFSPIFLEIINGRIIKEYYKNKVNRVISLITTVKTGIAILLFLCSLILYNYFEIPINKIIVLLMAENIFLVQTYGIENYFEYTLASKNVVIIDNFIKIISNILQYVAIYFKADIIIIPLIRLIMSILRCITLNIYYSIRYNKKIRIYFNKKFTFFLVKDSFYLWISFIAFIFYTQIDKVMIEKYLGTREVGIYSISLQLINVLSILLPAFQTSVYPKLLNLYKTCSYQKYLEVYLFLNTIITYIYLILIIISIFVVKKLFLYVYSSQYVLAINSYIILTISVLFRANGSLQSTHLTLKRITSKIFYKTVFGVILNVILNLYFIPKFGIVGAAISTSITQIFTILLLDIFISEYRENFYLQLKSFNPINFRRKNG